MALNVHVMQMLFGLDRLPRRLAEHGAQLRGRLFPLRAGEAFGADDEPREC